MTDNRLPPPDPDRAPVKANLFHLARGTRTQLLPMFDDDRPGAFVPAVAMIQGARDWGRFFHRNTVDEVTVCFGSNGGVLETGSIMAGGRQHGVDSFLQDPADPDAYMIMVITQRQSDGQQDEAITFRCTACNHKLFAFEFSASSPPGSDEMTGTYPGRSGDRFAMFVTQWGSWAAAEAFNEDASKRTCEQCGHLNDPFPVAQWGWFDYVDRHASVNEAYRQLEPSMSGV